MSVITKNKPDPEEEYESEAFHEHVHRLHGRLEDVINAYIGEHDLAEKMSDHASSSIIVFLSAVKYAYLTVFEKDITLAMTLLKNLAPLDNRRGHAQAPQRHESPQRIDSTSLVLKAKICHSYPKALWAFAFLMTSLPLKQLGGIKNFYYFP